MTKRSWRTDTPCGATIALQAFFPSRSPVIPAGPLGHAVGGTTTIYLCRRIWSDWRGVDRRGDTLALNSPRVYRTARCATSFFLNCGTDPRASHGRITSGHLLPARGYVPGRPVDRRCQTGHLRCGGCRAASCGVNDAEGDGETDLGDFALFQNRASAPVLQSPLPPFLSFARAEARGSVDWGLRAG
jgi:hypothetical protein